jgi:hypothetical protein
MSHQEELAINNFVKDAYFYYQHIQDNESYLELAQKTIDNADNILKKNIRESFNNISAEVIINFCESAMLIPKKDQRACFYID